MKTCLLDLARLKTEAWDIEEWLLLHMCNHARRVPSRTLTSSGLAAFAREELARIRQRLLSRKLQAKRRLQTLIFHVMSLTLIPKRALRNALCRWSCMVTNRDLIGITKRACTLCKCRKCRCCFPMRERCGSNFGVVQLSAHREPPETCVRLPSTPKMHVQSVC